MINAQPADGIIHAATYELASANLESSVFANINEVNSPNPSPGPSNMRAAKLNGLYDSTRIGASILLRVMPEDQLELSALYYWEEDTVTHSTTTSQDMLGSLLGALTGGVGGYSGNEGPDGTLLNGLLNGRNYNTAFGAIKDEITDPNLPRAYLNYMVFDRNMNLVAEQSGAIQVGSVTGNWTMLEPDEPLTIGQDGYVLVSVDNAWDMDVHFDQVKVTFYKGMIKQEQHYYPYGLAVNAAQDATIEPNQNKYQGKELQDELNVQLYDFHARQYDPQIGKFWGLDPADEFPSGYTGMGNDPANLVDPTGMNTKKAGQEWALNPGCRWSDLGQTYVPGNGGGPENEIILSTSSGANDAYMERMLNQEIEKPLVEKASSEWQWYPLNKEDLEALVSAATGLTGGALQNKVGEVFQNAYNAFNTAMGEPGYAENKNGFASRVEGRENVVPDGISAGKIIYSDGKIALAPGTSWHEVKAGRGTIYKSSFNNQPWGMVTAVAAQNPFYASKGWVSLTFATTHNMRVSSSLITDAKKMYNVNVTQIKAMYRHNKGGYQVTFYNPSVVNYYQMRYLSPARPSVYLNLR